MARHCLYLPLASFTEQPHHPFRPFTPFVKWRETLLGQRVGVCRWRQSRKYISYRTLCCKVRIDTQWSEVFCLAAGGHTALSWPPPFLPDTSPFWILLPNSVLIAVLWGLRASHHVSRATYLCPREGPASISSYYWVREKDPLWISVGFLYVLSKE